MYSDFCFFLFTIKTFCCVWKQKLKKKQEVISPLLDVRVDGYLYGHSPWHSQDLQWQTEQSTPRFCFLPLTIKTLNMVESSVHSSVKFFDLWLPGGAALVAVCDVSKQEKITQCMKTLGLLCHRPYYYARLKPRGGKAYENVSS